jgi:hypothetical protein
MTLVRILLGALVACGLVLIVRVAVETRPVTTPGAGGAAPTPLDLVIGFVTNFFDTLGIGSFATTTALYRLFRFVPDELIPGTIIVGDALPVLTQAVLFISVVSVDPFQMTVLIAVCMAGGWIGAGIVASLSRRTVQLGLGGALHSWSGHCRVGGQSSPARCAAMARPDRGRLRVGRALEKQDSKRRSRAGRIRRCRASTRAGPSHASPVRWASPA